MSDDSLYNTEEILKLLRLEQTGEDRYRGLSHFMGSPNVFGGQVLGQSLYAASVTVDGRRPHSLHSLFILPGNLKLPIDFEVERVRDGGSFSTRRVVALQEGRRIFVMSASFQTPEEGLSHQDPAPACADPETLESSLPRWKQSAGSVRPYQPVPVDFRFNHDGDILAAPGGEPRKQVWTRTPIALGDDPVVHETLFAYVSDYGLLSTSLQPHGVKLGDKRLQIASLDHTIWFHRPFRMDEWLLFSMESPNASGGRGLCFGHVYNREGLMVASMAQEGLIRIRQ
ncbi:acyl-CoA thioesterase-2 [Noviherbaspirillum humi]|uniref:Acyl-CoA thioesterase 2 n=1 Tax=Noviherbaspirillum humi TaxID=1688639 RepID=A0A239HD54_9BURK|nr:acyl-CoA thioesterase II [Noviherbaspirillum humi]SNS79085.1 acyl-CoA thioesterase-2 [Noviherbaspirillum humi]